MEVPQTDTSAQPPKPPSHNFGGAPIGPYARAMRVIRALLCPPIVLRPAADALLAARRRRAPAIRRGLSSAIWASFEKSPVVGREHLVHPLFVQEGREPDAHRVAACLTELNIREAPGSAATHKAPARSVDRPVGNKSSADPHHLDVHVEMARPEPEEGRAQRPVHTNRVVGVLVRPGIAGPRPSSLRPEHPENVSRKADRTSLLAAQWTTRVSRLNEHGDVAVAEASRSKTGRIRTMRVTEKGQVTIPKELRDEFGIGAGSEVDFERADDTIVIRKVSDGLGRGARLVEQLRGRGDVAMSTDEIMALTRGD